MDSIIISIVIIIILIMVFKTLVSINNRDRKDRMKDLVHRFDILEKEYNLNIYKKEILRDSIVGLDKLRKKIFVFKNAQDKYDFIIVNIKDLKVCLKKKIYKSSMMQPTRNRRPDKYLDKIVLEFEYINRDETTRIIYYDSMIHNATEISDLDKIAGEWEKELTEMMNEDVKKIA